jgi:hypothetical protein
MLGSQQLFPIDGGSIRWLNITVIICVVVTAHIFIFVYISEIPVSVVNNRIAELQQLALTYISRTEQPYIHHITCKKFGAFYCQIYIGNLKRSLHY